MLGLSRIMEDKMETTPNTDFVESQPKKPRPNLMLR